MPEIKRKPGQGFDAFFREFTTAMRESGRLIRARETQFSAKKENKRKRKRVALYRLKAKGKYEYLEKIGKLKEGEKIPLKIKIKK